MYVCPSSILSRTSLSPITVFPASVELCVTPNQSPQTTWYTVASPITSSQRTENPVADLRTSDSIFPSIGEDLPDRACVAPSRHHASVNIAPYRAISNKTTTIALQPRSPDLAIDGSLSKCINVEDLGTDSLLYDTLIQEDPQLYSRACSARSASGDWLRLIDWSPASESRGRTPEPALKAPRDVHTGNSGSSGEPVFGVQVTSSTSIHGSPIGSPALSVSLSNEGDFIFFDPEQMFVYLQYMKTRLADVLMKTRDSCFSKNTVTNQTFQRIHNNALGDDASHCSSSQWLNTGFYSHLDTLLLQSPWLQNQIEELLYQACVESATAIRRRLLRMKNPRSLAELDAIQSGASESRASEWFSTRRSTLYSNSNGPGQGVHGFAMARSTTGTFAIHHRTGACEPGHGYNPLKRATIALTYLPAQTSKTQGLEVTFTQPPQSIWETRICPSIKTFNVITNDSEIIRCVELDDLQGMRLLFDRKEASPRDVDEAGYSLLSVSICLLMLTKTKSLCSTPRAMMYLSYCS